MPGPLKNPKHEAFALNVARMVQTGQTLDECYVSAGFKSGPKNAARLKKSEGVSSRIEEVLSRAASKVEVSIDRLLQEAYAIATFDLRNVVTWTGNLMTIEEREGPEDDGAEVRKLVSNNRVVFKDSAGLDPMTAACVSEVKQGKDGALSIKTHNKLGAIRLLMEYLGKLKPAEAPAVTNNFNITADKLAVFMQYSPLERARRMLFAMELAARDQEKTQAPAGAVIEGSPL